MIHNLFYLQNLEKIDEKIQNICDSAGWIRDSGNKRILATF